MEFCPNCGAKILKTPFSLRCSSRGCTYRERKNNVNEVIEALKERVKEEREHEKSTTRRKVFEAEVERASDGVVTINSPQPGFEEEFKEGDFIGYLKSGRVSPLGVVIFSGEGITVRLQPSTWVSEGDRLKVCGAENLIPYDLQLNHLDKLAQGAYRNISDVIFNKASFEGINKANKASIGKLHSDLDEYQYKALESILGLRDGELLLVIGPPGCGKTRVIREAVRKLSKKEKVLIASHTNRAVDNALEGLKDKLDVSLRVGRPEKVHSNVEEFLLGHRAKSWLGKELEQKNKAIKDIREKLNEFKQTTKLNNLSREERKFLRRRKIKKAEKAQTGPDELNKELKRLYDERNEMVERANKELVNSARIIGSTLIKSQLRPLEGVKFDTVLIDECSQASIPLALLGMVKAKKWVLFGDHNQLLPIFQKLSMNLKNSPRNERLQREELSAFCHLRNDYPNRAVWLPLHYRSNQAIINFSSRYVYGGKIRASKKCEGKVISGGNGFLGSGKPVVFLNVEGEQEYLRDAGSYRNEKEADVIVEVVNLLKDFVKKKDIGVIVPYRGQRDRIGSKLGDKVEVSTVDSFQGREKVVIVFGVTSTSERMIDFSADKNRFNVAVTRAISKLIVVGNKKAVELKSNLISDFIDYARSLGCKYDVETISGNVRQVGNQLRVKSPQLGIITGNLVGETAKVLFLEANDNLYLLRKSTP